jgi:hypothetical protein
MDELQQAQIFAKVEMQECSFVPPPSFHLHLFFRFCLTLSSFWGFENFCGMGYVHDVSVLTEHSPIYLVHFPVMT